MPGGMSGKIENFFMSVCQSVYMFVPTFRPKHLVDFSETLHDDQF